jgi:cell division protease FtsH
MNPKRRKLLRFTIWYFFIALIVMSLFQFFVFRPLVVQQTEVTYSQFLDDLAAGRIDSVSITSDEIAYSPIEPPAEGELEQLFTVVRITDPDLVDRLQAAGVTFSAEPQKSNILLMILGWIIPLLPLVLIWYFLFRRLGAMGGGVMNISKSKAQEIAGEMTGVKFADVGGVDEVEVELREIIGFLKYPERFAQVGAKLPKGVLLVGPPGTGKTLLARATAGEAGVPFFYISGSDFVEMFVGVGAARVRDLFEQAKQRAPCIIFIDEVDAIGQSRASARTIATNDEREQTLNQLLNEMDGFGANQGVVIMAATNRPEVLDKALLRPGRFDRQVQVVLPNETGRRQIIGIHTAQVSLGSDVDLDRLAQITPGFSGADLANIVNEAALLAVRRGAEMVSMEDFDLAIERIVAGLQRLVPLRDEVRRKVAYHEGGHALVAQLLPRTDPVHKVSIIPTAKGALGYTLQMPEEDQYLMGQRELEERMAVMLGGRAAEALVFGEPSTGATNDLERASDLARRMVTEFGMSRALGPVRYAPEAGFGYLESPSGPRHEIGSETSALIDKETRRIVEAAQDRALALLQANEPALHEVARVLQERETVSGGEITRIATELARGRREPRQE